MAGAFVLLTVDLGTEESVLRSLRTIEGVKWAHQVFGVYDIIAKIEDETTDGVKEVLQQKVRRLRNVRNTITLMVV